MKTWKFPHPIEPAIIALALSFAMSACSPANVQVQKETRFVMDTYATIQAPGDATALPKIRKALDRLEEVAVKFGVTNPGSALYEFNNDGTPVPDPEIIGVVERALRMSELSGGKFDVTIYPIMMLYDFYGEPRLPDPASIKDALQYVGYKNIVIGDGVMTKKKPGVGIDTGGIAKLYGIEEAVKVLRAEGVSSALIDLGGDVYAMGLKNGKPWKIGVQNPRGEGLIDTVEVTDTFVITSGDYERFFEKDGVRYHHLMDPATGYPARGLASVTVLGRDSSRIDGLSSSIFVMGMEKGFELAKRIGGVEVMAVTENMEIYYTEGFHKK